MKKLVLACCMAFLSMGLFAQAPVAPVAVPKFNIDEVTKLITYNDQGQEVGVKDTLYYRALTWINKFFKNPIDATRVRDQQNGRIEGYYRIPLMNTDKEGVKTKSNLVVAYSFVIDVKDGKYRIKITDFNFSNPSKHGMEVWLDKTSTLYGPQCDSYLVQVDEYVRDMIKKFKLGMKPPVVKKDDW